MRMIVMFEKTERVRHLGHLDLLRAMHRALRRSGLPIRYSQGFNPHVVMSFASPLPVGVSGVEELMDVALDTEVTEDAFAEKMAIALPGSLPLGKVRAIDDQHPKLMARLETASYLAAFPKCDDSMAMTEAIPALLGKEEITAIRKTKRGETECNIRPMLHALSSEVLPDNVRMQLRVSLTEKETLKPDLLFQTLASLANANVPTVRLCRLRLYGQIDRQPVPLMEM